MDRIDAILDEAIKRIRSGESVEVADYCRDNPDLASEIQVLLPAILFLEQPQVKKNAVSGTRFPTIPGYQIIREIGRGGMGIVYEAVQARLNRRVALKVIRTKPHSRLQVARFCREVAVAAALQHPGIVPVYDSGETDGLAYYSMQLIEGETLDQIIRGRRIEVQARVSEVETDSVQGRTHILPADRGLQNWAESSDSELPSIPFENCTTNRTPNHGSCSVSFSVNEAADIALQLADAVAYAHANGVLHRDIKPSNILIDRQKKAWITDFGLAWHSEAESLTADGDIVGTVRYLAPEGFRGISSERSDLYSLGLTLFEMLEGRPAYAETQRAGLIAAVVNGPDVVVSASVPADLATICNKCLHKAPEDRYSTAVLLATDLRCFLEGRPIMARPMRLSERLIRWCNRNRAISVLVVLLLILVTGASSTYWGLSRNALRLEAETVASTQIARANLQMLLKTVDRFCRTVSEERRMHHPEFHELRELLHESAVALKQQVSEDSSIAPEVKFQLANVLVRLGRLGSTDNTLAESEIDLLKSRELLLAMLYDERGESAGERTSPQHSDIALELAICDLELGRIYFRMGRHEQSEKELRSSIEFAQEVESSSADTPLHRAGLVQKSRALALLGLLKFDMRQYDSSEKCFAESILILRELVAGSPDDLDLLTELAEQLTHLGNLRTANLKAWRQAEEPLQEAASLFEKLRSSSIERTDIDYSYCVLLRRLAKWLYVSKQLEKAIETQRTANSILAGLAENFDYDLAIQLEYGNGLRQLSGFLLVNDSADTSVLELLSRAEAVLADAVQKDSTDVARVMALADVCLTQADVMQRHKMPEPALGSIERAITTLAIVLNENPTNPRALEVRYFAAVTRAEVLTEVGRYSEALEEWSVAQQLSSPAFAEITVINRLRTEALAGNYVSAVQTAEFLLANRSSDKPIDRRVLSGAARILAIAAEKSGLSGMSESEDAPGELYARRSIELLGLYMPLDSNTLGFVAGCDDFQCLHDRSDFKSLLAKSADQQK